MKLLHTGDLHIGRRINEFNMLDDQKYILDRILNIAGEEKPDCILLAGDIYDKSQPSAEAVELLDEFLTSLVALSRPVFMISGNHDSPERLGFGSRIMKKNGLHIAGVFNGVLHKEALTDEFGEVNIYLLPHIKPALVRPYFQQSLESYDEAVQAVISAANVDRLARNILVAHQFVTSGTQEPERCESESISVGGLDNVDVSAFDCFDYVALGHLHGPQRVGRETVRYAGSPLKYSFSEARQHKSVTIAELGAKDAVAIRVLPLAPLREMRKVRGPISELLRFASQEPLPSQDYIHATITDEEEIYDAVGKLRRVYPNLMHLDFENSRTGNSAASSTSASGDVARKSPLELFSDFYKSQNNSELTPEQRQVLLSVLEQAGGAGI